MQHAGQALALTGILRDRLDGLAADLGLQGSGRALGDDLAVVDDPDAVGQDVGLLEVLGGQEDRHALPRQPPDLVP